MKTGKLCPAGWHVPTREDWAKLEYYLGGSSVAGSKMKSVTGWNSPNTDATNNSGFSGLPGGARKSNGSFDYAGGWGYWWSSTDEPVNTTWGCYLVNNSAYLASNSYHKAYGLSIRCVKE